MLAASARSYPLFLMALLISTVLFPGRNAAFIVLGILSHLLVRSEGDVLRINPARCL
jgi:hypothetical protein